MKVYRITVIESYRMDEQGTYYTIDEPTPDTMYYKTESEAYDVELPEGFEVVTLVDGSKQLRHGEDYVIIGMDEKGMYFEICNLDGEKVYVS